MFVGWRVLLVGAVLVTTCLLAAFVPGWFANPRRHESEHFRPRQRTRFVLVGWALVFGFGTAIGHDAVVRQIGCSEARSILGDHPGYLSADDEAKSKGYLIVEVARSAAGSSTFLLYRDGLLVATSTPYGEPYTQCGDGED